MTIEEDQKPWAPEHNGEIRVSNFQTGVFAGPIGSQIGQHRFKEGLSVQEEQETLSLYTPTCGLIELRAKAIEDPDCLVALGLRKISQKLRFRLLSVTGIPIQSSGHQSQSRFT